VAQFIDASSITEFFRTGFQHTAWRLEARREYQVDYESERYETFLRGEDPGIKGREGWLGAIQEITGRGLRVERARPPTTSGSCCGGQVTRSRRAKTFDT